MAIKLGNTVIGAIRLGAGEIANAYLGGVKVFTTIIEYLLDVYSGAKAAYSLRSLSTSYTGPVVEVRRDSDNAAKSFNDIEVTDGTMADWINNVPPLEIASGAAAAYSLRNLSFSYTGDVVEVRRASDDTTAAFKASEMGSVVENWVNATVALPLDTASGASAAYSLRDLSSSPTSFVPSDDTTTPASAAYVVQVRRDSDDDLKSFTASEVADGTMETWAQTVTVIDFDGVDDYVELLSGVSLPSDFTISMSYKLDTADTVTFLTGGGCRFAFVGGEQYFINIGSAYISFTSQGGGYFQGVNRNLTLSRVGDQVTIVDGDYQETKTVSSDAISPSLVGAQSTAPSGLFKGSIWSLNFNGQAAYDGYGATPWDDTIGTNDGTAYGSPTTTTLTLGNGYVSKWYDQSGNGNHATQATPASQPKIVDAGVLLDAIKTDGVDDFFDLTTQINFNSNHGLFAVYADDGANRFQLVGKSGSILNGIGWTVENATDIQFGLITANGQVENIALTNADKTQQNLVSYLWQPDSLSALVALNGNQQTDTFVGSFSIADNPVTVNCIGKSDAADGQLNISEIIIYSTDQTDNRKAIESNMADYYGNIDLPAGFDSGNNEVDGFVTKWYDQSGNGNDAVQATATYQPKIVDAGNLVTDGGAPAIKPDGSDDRLDLTSNITGGDYSVFATYRSSSNPSYLFSASGGYFNVGRRAGTGVWVYNYSGGGILTSTSHPSTRVLGHFQGIGEDVSIYGNGALIDSASGVGVNPTSISGLITAYGGTHYWNGSIQEVIIYDSDQSLVRKSIEDEIGHHYGISMPTEYTAGGNYNGYVTTWYDQSGNGNDAAQATATSQPKIYDATTGLIVDSDGKPTLDFDGSFGYLDLSNSISTTNGTLFTVANLSTADVTQTILGGDIVGGSDVLYPNLQKNSTSGELWSTFSGPTVSSVYVDGTVQSWTNRGDAYTAMVTDSQVLMSLEGVDTTTYSIERLGAASTSTSFKANGTISEIIIYDTDESANRAGIESNINSQYSIY